MLKLQPSATPHAEAAAVGAFIAGWVPHFGQEAPWRRLAEQVSQPAPSAPMDVLTKHSVALSQKVDSFAEAQLQKVDALAEAQSAMQADMAAAELRLLTALKALESRLGAAVQAAGLHPA